MTTHNPTNLFRQTQVTLTLLLVLLTGMSFGGEPHANSKATQPTYSHATTETHAVQQADFQTELTSDDGIPLAREDVIANKSVVVARANSPVTEEDLQLEITSRATDSQMIGFLRNTSMQQMLSVYREASQMIDARHVSPPSYEERTRGALQSVVRALSNEYFLKENGVNAAPQSVQAVQVQLQQMMNTQPARDLNQALAAMQTSAEIASRGIGIRREAIALEFFNGTLDSLDRYSAFLPESAGGRPGAMVEPTRTAGLEENMVGVGVELKGDSQGVLLVGVIDGSPAAELGLQAGDIITAVNQQPMAGKTLNEIADRLAGQAGSSVSVDILRNGKKYRGTMVRRQFYVSSVTGTKMIDEQNKVGYVRLKQFSESSAEDLEKALWTLHNQGMKSLVFDLRGNPGGLLDECVDLSDMFLPYGTIVSTKGRNASDNTSESAHFAKTWNVPMVVLVDENSASASEIFSAAIQENQRGLIVGRNSYGKGTVQTHFPMKSASGILKLTTAKFYSPTGREMAGAGVTPNVPVAQETESYRGTDHDADVQTALQVIARGTPAELAALSAKGPRAGMPLTSTSPVYNLPNGIKEY